MDFLKTLLLPLLFVLSLQVLAGPAWGEEEMFVLSLKDGSAVVVRSYKYTDDRVEFITENNLPGFVKKTEIVNIANMAGVPPSESELTQPQGSDEERKKNILLLAAAGVVVLIILLLIFKPGKKKAGGEEEVYGRKEMSPATQGHLSFEYKSALGGPSQWTIEVRSAYEEDGKLYVEGICTTTDKRKTFRADKVVGVVTDLSSDHHALMEDFFFDPKAENGRKDVEWQG